MKKIRKRLLAIITAFVLLLGPTAISAEISLHEAPDLNDNEVIILHTNDMHGQMDAKVQELAYVKGYKNHLEEKNNSIVTMIDSGDAFQGLPLNNLTRGAKMAEIMGKIGYDAMAIGNHEFDYPKEVALGTEDGWAKTMKSYENFNAVSANIIYEDTKAHVFEPGVVLAGKKNSNNADVTISVVGASTPETYVKADPRHTEGLTITDPIPAVIKEIKEGTSNHLNSDLIIVTVHLGTDAETKSKWRGDTLAQELSDLPELANKKVVVLDGHSHTAYPEGKRYGKNVIYGQTGSSLRNLGKITVNLDDFTESKAELLEIRSGYNIGEIAKYIKPDPTIAALLTAADADFDELTKGVMLDNNPVHLEGKREIVRSRETNLGNLITDAMLDYALDQWDNTAHVAVLNGGGIRSSIEKDKPITLKDILTRMPYGNRIVQIDVTGAELYAMYEHALKAPISEEKDANGLPLLNNDPAILHSSDSIRVQFDPRLPIGERVTDIKIMDPITGKMSDVDLAKVYKVVTLEFLAVGGDGFSMLGGARLEGINDADVFADFLLRENEDPFIDWTAYDPNMAPYRVLPAAKVVEDEKKPVKDEVKKPVKEEVKNDGKYVIPNTGVPTAIAASISMATVAASGLIILKKRRK